MNFHTAVAIASDGITLYSMVSNNNLQVALLADCNIKARYGADNNNYTQYIINFCLHAPAYQSSSSSEALELVLSFSGTDGQ